MALIDEGISEGIPDSGSGCGCLLFALLLPFLLLLMLSPMITGAGEGRGGEAAGGWMAFPPAVRRWREPIRRHAAAAGLDPCLVAAVVAVESGGDPRAVSPKGARGLMQVMPFHFGPGEDPLDPETNLRTGVVYLRNMIDHARGDLRRALAAYNGGPGMLRRPPKDWPAETRVYVARVLGFHREARARGGCP